MSTRKQKIEELIEVIGALKKKMVFCPASVSKKPPITTAQWGALMIIDSEKGSTVKNLAVTLGISSSAATQLVDILVANGYVEREIQVEDRRMVKLTLSRKTKTLVEDMRKQVLTNFLTLFKGLSDKELEQLIMLNKKIVRTFNQ